MKTTFTVPSISCSICANRIKNELSAAEGIEGVDVDLKAQAVIVSYNAELQQPQKIQNKIADMGYEVLK